MRIEAWYLGLSLLALLSFIYFEENIDEGVWVKDNSSDLHYVTRSCEDYMEHINESLEIDCNTTITRADFLVIGDGYYKGFESTCHVKLLNDSLVGCKDFKGNLSEMLKEKFD